MDNISPVVPKLAHTTSSTHTHRNIYRHMYILARYAWNLKSICFWRRYLPWNQAFVCMYVYVCVLANRRLVFVEKWYAATCSVTLKIIFFFTQSSMFICVHFNCKYMCLYGRVYVCMHVECVKPHGDGRSVQFATFCSHHSSSPPASMACWCEYVMVLHEFCVFFSVFFA